MAGPGSGPRPRGLRVLDRLHDRARGGVRDPRSGDAGARAPLRGPLRGLSGGRGPGRVRGRGADRLRDRDPLRARRDLRRGDRAPARAPRPAVRYRRRAGPRSGRDRDPSLGRLPRPADHRHAPLPAPAPRPRLGRAAQQHLEPAPPHGDPRRRPRDRRLRLAARAAAAAARRLRQLALPRPPRHRPAHRPHRDLHPHLPALRDPRLLRRPGTATPTSSRRWSEVGSDRRVDPALVERAARTTSSARSRCGSATRRPAARSRSRWPA